MCVSVWIPYQRYADIAAVKCRNKAHSCVAREWGIDVCVLLSASACAFVREGLARINNCVFLYYFLQAYR